MLLMLFQDFKDRRIDGYDTFHSSFGGGGYEPMGVESINPQGLAYQQFPIVPVDAVPRECPEFSIS